MTTTAEPSDPSSSPESQDSATPQRLGQRVLALLRRFRPQRSDRDAIETILEQPQNHETSDFDADERKMLSNILQLKHRTVEDVLVPRAEIPTAIALNSSTFNAAQFVGPAFAAILLPLGGPELAFAFNIFAGAAMVWALATIDVPLRAGGNAAHGTFLGDALAGVRYGARHPGIGPMLLLLFALGTMVRPLTELLSALAGSVFLLDVTGFSIMASSVGIGAMAGAVWMLRRGNKDGITELALLSGLVGGSAAFLIVNVTWLPFAVVCLAALGFSMTSGGIATQQVVQFAVPDEMRGRVLGLFGMIFRSGPALGALAMGRIGDAVGLGWPVTVGALVGLAIYVYAFSRRAQLHAALEGEPGAP